MKKKIEFKDIIDFIKQYKELIGILMPVIMIILASATAYYKNILIAIITLILVIPLFLLVIYLLLLFRNDNKDETDEIKPPELLITDIKDDDNAILNKYLKFKYTEGKCEIYRCDVLKACKDGINTYPIATSISNAENADLIYPFGKFKLSCEDRRY